MHDKVGYDYFRAVAIRYVMAIVVICLVIGFLLGMFLF